MTRYVGLDVSQRSQLIRASGPPGYDSLPLTLRPCSNVRSWSDYSMIWSTRASSAPMRAADNAAPCQVKSRKLCASTLAKMLALASKPVR